MVADRVLYFPHIRVPENEWFTRVLLYWDEVGSIVPSEYSRPERLGQHMSDLVRAQLVTLVTPGEYVDRIPRFTEAFVEFVDTNPTVAERQQLPLERQTTFRIHIEKMLWSLAHELCTRGLARQVEPAWYEVEEFTAVQFMAYLAAGLGQLPELGYMPATDQAEYLAAFASEHSGRAASTVLREHLRATVLEGVLPAPAEGVPANNLARFKSRYAGSLRAFRHRVESCVMDIALIDDPDMKTERLGLIKDQLREEVEELQARMREAQWPRIVFGTLCLLLAAAIPGALAAGTANVVAGTSAIPGVIAAIYTAFSGSGRQRQIMQSPLAYAALAQERLA